MSKTKTKKETMQEISLKSIKIGGTNPRKIYDFNALSELTKSIKENGIIQPLLVRPKEDYFELVCGERRYNASTNLGLDKVPCYVRELTDNQAQEIQLVENLERENVHPLHEAEAMYKLLNSSNYTSKTLADKFAKSESYIVKRLQLVSLINEWKDLFISNNEVKVSHAIIISKQTEDIQRKLLKKAFDWNGKILDVKELNSFINRNYRGELKNANFPFDLKDIVKGKKSCLECLKRTCANKLLFDGIEEEDKCLDLSCFNEKTKAYGVVSLKEKIESGESFLYIKESGSIADEVEELLKGFKLKTYKEYNDFYMRNPDDENAQKAVWVNGSKVGLIEYVELYKTNTGSKKKFEDCTDNEKLIKLKEREERAKELDAEKIYKKIVSSIKELNPITVVSCKKKASIDVLLERYMILSVADYHISQEIYKELGLKSFLNYKSKIEEKMAELAKLTDKQMTYAIRKISFDKYKSDSPKYETGFLLRKLAEEYKEVPIKEIEEEQNEIADKRKARYNERVKEIKKNIKNK